jgi:hypothetical protein
VATRGDAIWHREDGPFAYGRFEVRQLVFDPPGP